MRFLEDITEAIERLGVFAELDVPAAELPGSAVRLSDASVRDALAIVTGIVKQATTLQVVLAGVAASRSGRDRGHGGLVQGTGHRNTVEFLRDVTGVTRGEAIRAVRVGEALLDGVTVTPGSAAPDSGADARPDAGPPVPAPWHEPLREALLAGALTAAQHHAIRTGLGDPPRLDDRDLDEVTEAWRAGARTLAGEAPECTVEDLAARARGLRDMLDPTGAEERYAARFAKRSYRWSTTGDGSPAGHIVFDDEMGAWLRSLTDTALSPRRGGPRFVADDERQKAQALLDDPRSNEQLAYDLLIDLLRAGALAQAKDVYGTKEAGVRLVTITDTVSGANAQRDVFGRLIATAHSDDGTLTIPGSVLEHALCTTGTVEVTVDTCGNPLDAGREARLFGPRQKLVLAVRDGGCLWPGCDRPPAYCEAHHADPWAAGGRTDCDAGVLLCRFHHLTLHNNGWRITRDKKRGLFLLHPPPGMDGAPIVLRSKSPLRWLWDPPPERRHWRHAA